MLINSKLFFMEFIVNSLKILPENSEDTHVDTCVTVKFQDIEMQICGKDYGLALADFQNHIKPGNSCLFVLKPGEMKLEMSAFKKMENDTKQLIGSFGMEAKYIFQTMAQDYDGQINVSQTIVNSDPNVPGGSLDSLNSFCNSNIRPIEELPPTTKTIKKLYRLSNVNGEVAAILEAMMRITCFGSTISTPFKVGNEKMVPLAIYGEDDAKIKCPFGCKNIDLPVNCEEVLKEVDPCKAPQGSKTDLNDEAEFKEYTVEMNGNALVIRVPKGAIMKKVQADSVNRVNDENSPYNSKKTLPICCCAQKYPQRLFRPHLGKYAINTCALPPIHGNRKYPTIIDCANDRNIRNVCLQCNVPEIDPKPEANSPDQDPEIKTKGPPHGIEVCRKGWHDRNTDVFKLGLCGIELELRTPKNPNSTETFKGTKYAQVYEEDFDDIKAPVTKTETVLPKKAVKAKEKKEKKGSKPKK